MGRRPDRVSAAGPCVVGNRLRGRAAAGTIAEQLASHRLVSRVRRVSSQPCASSAITQSVNVSASWGWPSLFRVSVWRKLGVRAALLPNPLPEVGIASARQRRRHQGLA